MWKKQCQSRDSSADCGADHGEAEGPPAVHRGPWWSRHPPAVPGGPHARPCECPKEDVTWWKAHAGAGSWQDSWEKDLTLKQMLSGFVTT